LEKSLKINSEEFTLIRYPETKDNALRAWSNAELLVLDYIQNYKQHKLHLFNDRFGVWNCTLHDKELETIWTYASQKKAIIQNLERNNLSKKVVFKSPLEPLDKVDVALLKIPKSIELFELFLHQIHQASSFETEVVCGFMTKYFSFAYLKIAEKYFESITQTKAWKKARLLILKAPKKKTEINNKELLNSIKWKGNFLKQYYGVFSSNKIDIGTQFLLENLSVNENEIEVLDVASGNGIISYEVLLQNKNARVTLVDDFNLAIESSKLNIPKEAAKFVCTDCIEEVDEKSFDLILSNPPFHFEHENNIEVSLSLFNRIRSCLKNNGRFVMVANLHLNYKTHLEKLFSSVEIVSENSKFIIYECRL
jgi:23S rRNA (guanine1835-N2)-methyltransferase